MTIYCVNTMDCEQLPVHHSHFHSIQFTGEGPQNSCQKFLKIIFHTLNLLQKINRKVFSAEQILFNAYRVHFEHFTNFDEIFDDSFIFFVDDQNYEMSKSKCHLNQVICLFYVETLLCVLCTKCQPNVVKIQFSNANTSVYLFNIVRTIRILYRFHTHIRNVWKLHGNLKSAYSNKFDIHAFGIFLSRYYI